MFILDMIDTDYIEYNLGNNYACSRIRDKNKKLMYVTRRRKRKRKNYKLIFTMIFLESYICILLEIYIYYIKRYFLECILRLNEWYFRITLCTQIAKYMELLNVGKYIEHRIT